MWHEPATRNQLVNGSFAVRHQNFRRTPVGLGSFFPSIGPCTGDGDAFRSGKRNGDLSYFRQKRRPGTMEHYTVLAAVKTATRPLRR